MLIFCSSTFNLFLVIFINTPEHVIWKLEITNTEARNHQIKYMVVSKNMGKPWTPPPKSSILIGFSILNHPFWGTPIFGKTHILIFQGIKRKTFFVSMEKSFLSTDTCEFSGGPLQHASLWRLCGWKMVCFSREV